MSRNSGAVSESLNRRGRMTERDEIGGGRKVGGKVVGSGRKREREREEEGQGRSLDEHVRRNIMWESGIRHSLFLPAGFCDH